MKTNKNRLDQLLVELGHAQNRERAQALILTGDVLVDDVPVIKPGTAISSEAKIRLRKTDHPYVSRGALKLVGALETFPILVEGRIAMDVGASTGGFTEVLLLRGAIRVHAVDVGHNQLAWKIRNDPRVQVYEKTNARSLDPSLIGDKIDLFVMDVSFISVAKILPSLLAYGRPTSDWVVLVKPQFEVGREKVGKGGIVREESYRQEAILTVTAAAQGLGLVRHGIVDSPIEGTDGNREYLAWFKPGI